MCSLTLSPPPVAILHFPSPHVWYNTLELAQTTSKGLCLSLIFLILLHTKPWPPDSCGDYLLLNNLTFYIGSLLIKVDTSLICLSRTYSCTLTLFSLSFFLLFIVYDRSMLQSCIVIYHGPARTEPRNTDLIWKKKSLVIIIGVPYRHLLISSVIWCAISTSVDMAHEFTWLIDFRRYGSVLS